MEHTKKYMMFLVFPKLSPPYWDMQLEQCWQFYLDMYTYSGPDVLMSDYLFDTYG